MWFSELNEPVSAVFSRHWPGALNLGDITTIDWHEVEPVDILIGGFPCLNVKDLLLQGAGISRHGRCVAPKSWHG